MFDLNYYKYVMARNKMTFEDVARLLNVAPSTLYRKFRRGGDFTREEIVKHIEFFHLGYEELNRIFFAEEFEEPYL